MLFSREIMRQLNNALQGCIHLFLVIANEDVLELDLQNRFLHNELGWFTDQFTGNSFPVTR